MTLQTFYGRPHTVLQPYIDRFWGWESQGHEAIALPTVLPGTGAEFFFHYGTPFRGNEDVTSSSGEFGQAHLLCVRRTPLALAPSSNVGFIAVRFRAGAVHRFISVPGAELLDSNWSATDLWGAAGTTLAERIRDAASFSERMTHLQSFLARQLLVRRSDLVVEAAVACLYQNAATTTVAQLAQHLGIGRRQLERRFLALTGQTPVEVRRTSRFQKTVRSLLLDPSVTAADAALAHGYFDQAHFIHDFKALATISPQQWLRAARSKTHFYNTSRPGS